MKNTNKPVWLVRMNIIALIVALLLVVSAVAFVASVFNGFSGFILLDLLIAVALPVIGIMFLVIFPPTLMGLVYEIVVIVLNIKHSHDRSAANPNNYYFNNEYNNYHM